MHFYRHKASAAVKIHYRDSVGLDEHFEVVKNEYLLAMNISATEDNP